jgi:beta-N-acetylhexosaminidase
VPREPDHVYRHRRLVAAGVAGVVVIGVVLAIGALGGDGGSEPQEESNPPADVPLDKLVGQRVMVRMRGKATSELIDAAHDGTIGGVILFPPPGIDADEVAHQVGRLQQAAERGGNPPLLVAIDQEGGPITRLPAGPPRSSPAELGAEGDAAAAAAEGADTAAYLLRFGVNVDLAPVLDVPAPGSFMAGRAFGDEPATVAEVGVAFAEGLARGGVAATAKHFPGLGLATINTDVAPSVVDASRSELRRGLEPFDEATASGIGLVMMSNATYSALDPDTPAGLSARIVERELRDRLGFDGVVITDDLEAGSITATLAPPDAAVEAARAGADIVLFAKGAEPEPIAQALLEAARRGALDRASLEASYARIAALKEAVAGS